MDERKKIQVKNTARNIATATFMPVCAAVFAALAPITGTVDVMRYIKEKKEKGIHVSNKEDVLRALQIYSQALMEPTRSVIAEMKNDAEKGKKELKQYDDKMVAAAQELERKIAAEKQQQQAAEKQKIALANTPEALMESGVQYLLDIIETTPNTNMYLRSLRDTDKFADGVEPFVLKDELKDELAVISGIDQCSHYYIRIGDGIIIGASGVLVDGKKVLDIPELQQATVENCVIQRTKEFGARVKRIIKEQEQQKKDQEVQDAIKLMRLRANVSEK